MKGLASNDQAAGNRKAFINNWLDDDIFKIAFFQKPRVKSKFCKSVGKYAERAVTQEQSIMGRACFRCVE